MSSKNLDDDIAVERGDILYIRFPNVFEEAEGSEQAGLRPAIVVQNNVDNKYSPTIIVIPTTLQMPRKKFPTDVYIENMLSDGKISVALASQIRVISKTRIIKKVGKIPEDKMKEIDKAIRISLYLE